MLAMCVRVEKFRVPQYPRKRIFNPRFFYGNFLRGLSYEDGPISRRASLHLQWKVN